MTTPDRCFCGEVGQEAHHPTGTGTDHAHLDPEFTIPDCIPCHELIHEDYRFNDIVLPLLVTSFLEIQEHKLRCMGLTLLRIAEVNPDLPWVGPYAVQLIKMADETAREIGLTKRCHPGEDGENE